MNLVAPALVKRYAKGTDSDATDCMIVNALDRQAGGPDDNSAQGNQLIAHTLTSSGFDASEDGTGRGTPLATFQQSSMAGKGTIGYDPDADAAKPVKTQPDGQMLHQGDAVRRLTPTECERLQSWPDGWTLAEGPSLADVPQHAARLASPIDPQPDGPRYAACGDGVTSNVAEWIGRRLLAHVQEARHAA